MFTIDAEHLHYKELNHKIQKSIENGENRIHLVNVNGQRYIGDCLKGDAEIIIDGVPGNDVGAFMDGPTLIIRDNGQDGIANTMNSGKIVIHGHAGDVCGYGMRGGKLFIEGDIGYRVGIHMKEYQDKIPIIIAGGSAGDFLGEYMAGGILILLGLNCTGNTQIAGDYIGTGMHGGVMYIRGRVQPHRLGKEVGEVPMTGKDKKLLKELLTEYCKDFSLPLKKVLNKDFQKLIPVSHRPYGTLYAY